MRVGERRGAGEAGRERERGEERIKKIVGRGGVFLYVGELRVLCAKISLFLHVDVISGSFEKLIFVCGYYKEPYTKIVDADTYSLFLTCLSINFILLVCHCHVELVFYIDL